MKRMLLAGLVAALVSIGAAAHADHSYHRCEITNGQVFSCDGSWYQGKAVVRR